MIVKRVLASPLSEVKKKNDLNTFLASPLDEVKMRKICFGTIFNRDLFVLSPPPLFGVKSSAKNTFFTHLYVG